MQGTASVGSHFMKSIVARRAGETRLPKLNQPGVHEFAHRFAGPYLA